VNANDLITLIIAFTCVGVFIATAIATVLDLFNLLQLERGIRKTLHKVLLAEIVVVSVAAYAGFLNPKPIVRTMERVDGLEKEVTDATKALKRTVDTSVVVAFPWVDTASAPGRFVAAAPYLHALGIRSRRFQPSESQLVIVNNLGLYSGQAVKPATSQNMLTQIHTGNIPASFTLEFSEAFSSVSFTRPALFPATESGITHPAWSAHALDNAGNELSSQSEALTRSFSDVPARTYTLSAPNGKRISAVRFDSDPRLNDRPFAAFSTVLIESLTMVR
jgi:hypothetical protein